MMCESVRLTDLSDAVVCELANFELGLIEMGWGGANPASCREVIQRLRYCDGRRRAGNILTDREWWADTVGRLCHLAEVIESDPGTSDQYAEHIWEITEDMERRASAEHTE